MPRKIESVSVDLISLREQKYQFSIPVSIKPLIKSIDQNGIIHPVLLTRETGSEKYSVICGYKRVLASIKLGITKIDALIPLSGPDPVRLFYLNITDTLSQRELHFIENGTILRMLRDSFRESRKELVNAHMKFLGLQPSGFNLDRLVSISSMESVVKHFIVKYKIPLHVSEHFLRFTAEERAELVGLLRRFRFGTNKVKEFLTFLKEISIREKISPLEIIDRFDIRNVIESGNGSASEAGAAVRAILKKKRFPVTENLENEFQELVAALAIPGDVSISHTKNFEESGLNISLSLKEPGRLEAISRALMELAGKKEFKQLFEL